MCLELRWLPVQVIHGPVRNRRLVLFHPPAFEEWMRPPHLRRRFQVACITMLAHPSNQRAGQSQRAELRMDDHAADRADVAVDETQVARAPAVYAQHAKARG